MTLQFQQLQWQKHLPLPPSSLTTWLQYQGSFMERLKKHDIYDARIKVLRQDLHVAEPEESALLNMTYQTDALIREVLIYSENRFWMFARTVFPVSILTGKYEELADLKERSLGSVLFQDPDMRRGEFEFAHIPVLSDAYIPETQENLWARRSLFFLQDKQSILLTEIFLSDMKTI